MPYMLAPCTAHSWSCCVAPDCLSQMGCRRRMRANRWAEKAKMLETKKAQLQSRSQPASPRASSQPRSPPALDVDAPASPAAAAALGAMKPLPPPPP